jgi:hypothetical protein
LLISKLIKGVFRFYGKKHTKSVAIFGAGIAGMTAAQEFSDLGYKVFVYECCENSGGFFKSIRRKEDNGMPSEYSWHGIGPWYHNVFEIFNRIPFDNDEGKNIYECALSRPIDFGIAPNVGLAQFDDSRGVTVDVKKMFRMSSKDKVLWAWILLKVWCSNKRSLEHYSTINAKVAWEPYLSKLALDTWCSSFGPWVGSDWCHVSLHQAGHFFRKQLITKPRYWHKGDSEGGPWSQGARSGWLLLNGPSSEVLFDKWLKALKKKDVEFSWNKKLTKLECNGKKIISAILNNDEIVNADIYVLAINPFSAADIIDRTPALLEDSQLKLLRPLVQDGPHNQVSFRIAFKEKIYWPRKRCAVVITDSAFNLTMFAQEQAWTEDIYLGENILSLWTATACVSKIPGPVHGIPLEKCTKDQFIEEVMFQLNNSGSLNQLIKEANKGRGWASFTIEKIEVWHEWRFSPEGITSPQPKWVNTNHTQRYMPEQKTSFSNLVLAGSHTKTEVDVWSIEGAVESGKKAVKIFEPSVLIIPQYKPLLLKFIWAIDDFLYILKLPNFIDVSLILICILLFLVLI